MPGWLVSALLALLVGVALLAFGSSTLFTIFVLMFGWFVLLGLVALVFETLVQAIGRRFRRSV